MLFARKKSCQKLLHSIKKSDIIKYHKTASIQKGGIIYV